MQKLFFFALYPLVWLYAPLMMRIRILVICNNEALLVKSKFSSGVWQLPGGGKHANETRKACAIRELFEETAIDVSTKTVAVLLPFGTYKEQGLTYRSEVYFVKLTKKPNIKLNSELKEYCWVEINKTIPGVGRLTAKSIKHYRDLSSK